MFERLAVDAGRLAIEGFSDGASYAVSLSLANGDLFTHVIAFSPGLVDQVAQRGGQPSIFIAHGTRDERLPIDASSVRRVTRLERDGYEVRFRKFDDGHEVPAEVAREAVGGSSPSKAERRPRRIFRRQAASIHRTT